MKNCAIKIVYFFIISSECLIYVKWKAKLFHYVRVHFFLLHRFPLRRQTKSKRQRVTKMSNFANIYLCVIVIEMLMVKVIGLHLAGKLGWLHLFIDFSFARRGNRLSLAHKICVCALAMPDSERK